MSSKKVAWKDASIAFSPGMKIVIRREGFEYSGVIENFSFPNNYDELSIVVTDLKRKKWPSPNEQISISDATLYIDTSTSIISDDSGGFWYFTLPRANHGIIYRK